MMSNTTTRKEEAVLQLQYGKEVETVIVDGKHIPVRELAKIVGRVGWTDSLMVKNSQDLKGVVFGAEEVAELRRDKFLGSYLFLPRGVSFNDLRDPQEIHELLELRKTDEGYAVFARRGIRNFMMLYAGELESAESPRIGRMESRPSYFFLPTKISSNSLCMNKVINASRYFNLSSLMLSLPNHAKAKFIQRYYAAYWKEELAQMIEGNELAKMAIAKVKAISKCLTIQCMVNDLVSPQDKGVITPIVCSMEWLWQGLLPKNQLEDLVVKEGEIIGIDYGRSGLDNNVSLVDSKGRRLGVPPMKDAYAFWPWADIQFLEDFAEAMRGVILLLDSTKAGWNSADNKLDKIKKDLMEAIAFENSEFKGNALSDTYRLCWFTCRVCCLLGLRQTEEARNFVNHSSFSDSFSRSSSAKHEPFAELKPYSQLLNEKNTGEPTLNAFLAKLESETKDERNFNIHERMISLSLDLLTQQERKTVICEGDEKSIPVIYYIIGITLRYLAKQRCEEGGMEDSLQQAKMQAQLNARGPGAVCFGISSALWRGATSSTYTSEPEIDISELEKKQLVDNVLSLYRGIRPRCTKSSLQKALRSAAASGKADHLQSLCRLKGVDINSQGPSDKKTALHWAMTKGHVECVEILLSFDARRDIKDGEGRTPQDYIKEGSEIEKIWLKERKTQTVSSARPQ